MIPSPASRWPFQPLPKGTASACQRQTPATGFKTLAMKPDGYQDTTNVTTRETAFGRRSREIAREGLDASSFFRRQCKCFPAKSGGSRLSNGEHADQPRRIAPTSTRASTGQGVSA